MHRTQDFNIRYVKEKDYPYVVEASKRVIETVLPGKPFNENKIKDLFTLSQLNQTHAGIILADPEDNPKGFILAGIDEFYFHDTKVAICLSIWVEPECRGHGLDMIRAFEKWAKYKKAERVILSAFTNLSPKNFSKVLTRYKYKPQELVYWKGI